MAIATSVSADRNRARKMLALIAALEAFAQSEGRRFTSADVRAFSPQSWKEFAHVAGCKPPSDETIDELVEHYASRERILNPFKGYPRAVQS